MSATDETDLIERLQGALMYWMPSVTEATDTGLERSAGDDAYLLAGYSGEFPKTCWGDDIAARLEALQAEVDGLRKARFAPIGVVYADGHGGVPRAIWTTDIPRPGAELFVKGSAHTQHDATDQQEGK